MSVEILSRDRGATIALIRILDAQGGYMTHEDQMTLRAARELTETIAPEWPGCLAGNIGDGAACCAAFRDGVRMWCNGTAGYDWHPGCGRIVER